MSLVELYTYAVFYETRPANYFSTIYYYNWFSRAEAVNPPTFFQEVIRYPILLVMLIMWFVAIIIIVLYLVKRCFRLWEPRSIWMESRSRKCIRYVIWAMLLIPLIFVICGLIISIVYYTRYLNTPWKQFAGAVGAKPHATYMTHYSEPLLNGSSEMDESSENIVDVIGQCETGLRKSCLFGRDSEEDSDLLDDMTSKVQQLTFDLIEWNDYLRFFYGEMTTVLFSTSEGRHLLQESYFAYFYVMSVQVDTIMRIKSALSSVKYVVTNLENRYTEFRAFAKLFEGNRSQLIPTLPKYQSQEIYETDKSEAKWRTYFNPTRSHSKREVVLRDCPPLLLPYRAVHRLVFDLMVPIIFAYVIFVWLLLLFILILTMFRATERLYRWITILLLAALYMFFIYFFIGGLLAAGMYLYVIYVDYFKCRIFAEQDAERIRPATTERNDEFDWAGRSNPLFMPRIPLFTQSDPLVMQEKAKSENYFTKSSPRCNEIIALINIPYLRKVHEKMNKYVTVGLQNVNNDMDLSICHLNHLKTLRIDSFARGSLFKSASDLADLCERLTKILDKGLENYTAQCLNVLEEIEMCFNRHFTPSHARQSSQTVTNSTKPTKKPTKKPTRPKCPHDWGHPCPHYRFFISAMSSGLFLLTLAMLPALLIVLLLTRLYPLLEQKKVVKKEEIVEKKEVVKEVIIPPPKCDNPAGHPCCCRCPKKKVCKDDWKTRTTINGPCMKSGYQICEGKKAPVDAEIVRPSEFAMISTHTCDQSDICKKPTRSCDMCRCPRKNTDQELVCTSSHRSVCKCKDKTVHTKNLCCNCDEISLHKSDCDPKNNCILKPCQNLQIRNSLTDDSFCKCDREQRLQNDNLFRETFFQPACDTSVPFNDRKSFRSCESLCKCNRKSDHTQKDKLISTSFSDAGSPCKCIRETKYILKEPKLKSALESSRRAFRESIGPAVREFVSKSGRRDTRATDGFQDLSYQRDTPVFEYDRHSVRNNNRQRDRSRRRNYEVEDTSHSDDELCNCELKHSPGERRLKCIESKGELKLKLVYEPEPNSFRRSTRNSHYESRNTESGEERDFTRKAVHSKDRYHADRTASRALRENDSSGGSSDDNDLFRDSVRMAVRYSVRGAARKFRPEECKELYRLSPGEGLVPERTRKRNRDSRYRSHSESCPPCKYRVNRDSRSLRRTDSDESISDYRRKNRRRRSNESRDY